MRKINILLFFIFGFISCNNKKPHSIILNKSNWSIKAIAKKEINSVDFKDFWFIDQSFVALTSSGWIENNSNHISFRYLNSWNPVESKDYFFIAGLSDFDENSFVVTIVYEKEDSKVRNLQQYLKEVDRQVKIDTSEVFLKSDFYLVTINNKKEPLVFGEIETIIDSTRYKTIICYAEDKRNVFDFSMKMPLKQFNKKKYVEFATYYTSFINREGVKIIDVLDSITSIYKLDFN